VLRLRLAYCGCTCAGLNASQTYIGIWLERHRAVAARAAAEHVTNNFKRVFSGDAINLKAVTLEAGWAAAVVDAAAAGPLTTEELRAEALAAGAAAAAADVKAAADSLCIAGVWFNKQRRKWRAEIGKVVAPFLRRMCVLQLLQVQRRALRRVDDCALPVNQ
jgi:hypothetical protein